MTKRQQRVCILGSTGSIGLNSLTVLANQRDSFRAVTASAHNNWQLLAKQARDFDLAQVVITNTEHGEQLTAALSDTDTEVLVGHDKLPHLSSSDNCDIVIVAVVGAAGLPAVLQGAKAGKRIAIANKESLVMAGCLVMPLAKKYGAEVLPIDSEHSAILQAMHSGHRNEVKKVILTCSGGPFRTWNESQLADVTLAQALNHPTWDMGPKITIDSATQMNKALEIIEARWLFDLDETQIEVLVHPESIIHSLVEFCDTSVIAQLSDPDMKLPIQYALTFPARMGHCGKRLDLAKLGQLTFEAPDFKRFPALKLGFDVARKGGTAGAVLNGANEAAVEAFRNEKITFKQITELTAICLEQHSVITSPTLAEIIDADKWAREHVANNIAIIVR
jgi:1-deoxy-D-xylulose-5-phosphate reductoisomerase